MGSIADKPGSNGQDSAVVRATFRQLIQYGAVLGIAMGVLHSIFFWSHDDPDWMFTATICVLLLPLRPMVGVDCSDKVFFTGLTCFLIVALGGLSVQSLRYGSSSAFHLLMLPFASAVIVAGRVGLSGKWAQVFVVGALILWLDEDPDTGLRMANAAPDVVRQLRIANVATAVVLLSALMQRYFLVIVLDQQRLMEFASIDALTGLYNRRHFLATAAQELARSERYGGSLCVALADLDHFKSINDQFGHDAGDTVLKHVSHVIQSAARHADCVCRWGGEEFIVLLPQTEIDGAVNIAERIRQQVSEAPLLIGGQALQVTLTLGVAMLSPGEAFDNAVRRADKALYTGKAAGRNRAVLAPV